GARHISRDSIGRCGSPRWELRNKIPGSSGSPFVCSRESETSRSCLRMTRFQISRRATSARSCIAIDLQRRTSIDKLACGGNGRSSENTCRQFLSKACDKSDNYPRLLSKAQRQLYSAGCQREDRL